MSSLQLTDTAGRGWVNVRPDLVFARGYVEPRLHINLYMGTSREKRYANVHVMRAKLTFDNEQVAEGFLTGVGLNYVERPVSVELSISREALQFVSDKATGNKLDFILELSGWLEVWRELTEDDPTYLGESPPPGERGFISIGGGGHGQIRFQVARSDWFTQVMEPVGTLNYVATEIPLPKGTLGDALQPALNHLREAERRYATGDDAEVFFRCRAALESMPGAPKNIFAPLADSNLADCMNSLTKESVDYLHRGRHPESNGEFPVDHGDAQFALALTRLLVAQTSRLLSDGAS